MNSIIVYSQPSCPQCKMVKMMLDKKNIKYEVIEDTDLMRTRGIVHTPTLEVDGVRFVAKPMFDKIKEL